MKEIQLTQGKVAFVDDEDFEQINKYKWYANKRGLLWYAIRNLPRDKDGKQDKKPMHREILGTPPGMMTDHKDRNGLNNQKYNLRFCTNSQNQQNCDNHKDSESKFKGIKKDKKSDKWVSRICVSGKRLSLGYFLREEEAARTYDMAAIKFFGEFARINFPLEI